MIDEMDEAGVRIHWFRPLRGSSWTGEPPHPSEGVVVDEAIGFTGGVGIADEWRGDARDEHEWRDTHFRICGPAVDGLRAAFLDNWLETDDELFEASVDRFPDQPQPGSTVVQACGVHRRRAGATSPRCSARSCSSPRRGPDHDRVLRARYPV